MVSNLTRGSTTWLPPIAINRGIFEDFSLYLVQSAEKLKNLPFRSEYVNAPPSGRLKRNSKLI